MAALRLPDLPDRGVVGGGVVGLGVVFTVPVVLGALVARHPVEPGISLARSSLSAVEDGEAPTATA